MLAKPMTTIWNEEENSNTQTVKTATLIGLALTALIIILLPNLYPFAKIAMVPMTLGISYITTALICARQGQPLYELNFAGIGLGISAAGLFFIASIL